MRASRSELCIERRRMALNGVTALDDGTGELTTKIRRPSV